MTRAEEIRAAWAAVDGRVAAACERAGRARPEVTLVAVTKTFPASDVEHVIAAGATDVGENRVQEGRDKRPLVSASARWHLIGHLQSNKAKDAVRHFDTIHSVDSLALAEKVARAVSASGSRYPILLEVNIGREPQKAGVDPSAVPQLVRQVAALDALSLDGLMIIPPAGDAEDSRRWFRELKKMRDDLDLRELSMGMTDDFEVAIEEGATIVRVGRAIFGSRG